MAKYRSLIKFNYISIQMVLEPGGDQIIFVFPRLPWRLVDVLKDNGNLSVKKTTEIDFFLTLHGQNGLLYALKNLISRHEN